MLLEAIKNAVKNYIPLAGNKIKRVDHVYANDKIIEELYYSDWGIPKPYLGTALPDGYVWCDGTTPTVLRSNCHAKFIEAMSTNYPGDGSTTINIPIIKPGSSLIQSGKDTTSGVTFTQGTSGGEVKHLLTANESGLQAHTHVTVTGANSTNQRSANEGSGPNIVVSEVADNGYSSISTGPAVPSSGTSSAITAHNNMPPYFVVKYILRYA